MAAHPIVLHTPLNFIYGLAWIACLGETVGRRAVACFGHGEAIKWCFTASQTQCPLDSDCLNAPALSVGLIVTLFPHSFPFHRSKQPRSSSITKDPLLVPPFRSLPSPLHPHTSSSSTLRPQVVYLSFGFSIAIRLRLGLHLHHIFKSL